MAHHQFRDENGALWDAWDVYPTSMERRHEERRQRTALEATRQLPLGAAERRRTERRHVHETRSQVTPAFVRGWVVFQTAHERRRLAPVPERWEELGEAELRVLCAQAAPSSKPRRLIE